MLLLAFDTATPAVTAALHDGGQVIAQSSAVDARGHSELLAAAISRLLRECAAVPADLTGVAVGTGPGPYTGLRAALVTARVLGSALRIRVDGVCTLDVIARAAAGGAGGGEFIVATDARRKEVYWARYSPQAQRLGEPQVSAPDLVPDFLPVAGEGPFLYPCLAGRQIEPRYPSAAQLAAIAAQRQAAGSPAGPADPLYLRRPDAREPGRPKRVTP